MPYYNGKWTPYTCPYIIANLDQLLLGTYVCVEDGQSRSSAQYRVVPIYLLTLVVPGSSFWFVGVAPFSNDAQRNQYEGPDKNYLHIPAMR